MTLWTVLAVPTFEMAEGVATVYQCANCKEFFVDLTIRFNSGGSRGWTRWAIAQLSRGEAWPSRRAGRPGPAVGDVMTKFVTLA